MINMVDFLLNSPYDSLTSGFEISPYILIGPTTKPISPSLVSKTRLPTSKSGSVHVFLENILSLA